MEKKLLGVNSCRLTEPPAWSADVKPVEGGWIAQGLSVELVSDRGRRGKFYGPTIVIATYYFSKDDLSRGRVKGFVFQIVVVLEHTYF